MQLLFNHGGEKWNADDADYYDEVEFLCRHCEDEAISNGTLSALGGTQIVMIKYDFGGKRTQMIMIEADLCAEKWNLNLLKI